MKKFWSKALRVCLPAVLIAVIGIVPHFITALQAYADSVDLYWYPVAGSGTGNWNGGGHWATAADGTGLGHADPTPTNNAFFTSTSFTGAGQIVTVNTTGSALSVDWTGATNNPTLAHSAELDVFGSYTGISAMTHTGTGLFQLINGTVGLTFTPGTTFSCPNIDNKSCSNNTN